MVPLEPLARRLRHFTLLQWQCLIAAVLLAALCLLVVLGSGGAAPEDYVADVQGTSESASNSPEDFAAVFRLIASRELFRPPIAQETSDSAAMTAQRLLQRLSLVGLISDGKEVKAWIAVRNADGPEAPSSLNLCGPGDVVGGFIVKEVRPSGVLLEISGQVVELRR